ncbi:VWA domain-containing protein [Actinomadura sp. NEAU-AAG7]|uniref:vWA domain-containing protein n=1 Tax=Actinomadura sp. NEAU-AAG7 TaxID=2839640 RepID=UPI001BE48456|nr:VWA domain-containing protein [Actinomadura sp. NEAU-AAG7]MBT2207519.1 VWA domain-containing protein [Actinomadura sp. NEAU-AAG7]
MPNDQGETPFASVRRPRPLPVLVLADVSGSMAEHGKIEALNQAMASMIGAFARERSPRGEITIGVLVFGGQGAALHLRPVPAASVTWTNMDAVGGPSGTPMGAVFELARRVLDDEDLVPASAYDPTLVLISDGRPTSEWRPQLDRLLGSPRGGRSLRLAVAIGPEAGSAAYQVLEAFVADPLYPVVRAEEADRVTEIFRYLTRSMSVRVNSARPDDVSVFDPDDLSDLSD